MDSIFVFLRLLSILGINEDTLVRAEMRQRQNQKKKRMDPLHRGTRRFSLFFSRAPCQNNESIPTHYCYIAILSLSLYYTLT